MRRTLADPVRAAAENDDLVLVRRRALVGQRARERRLIGRIHVGGGGGELGSTGVDALERRANAERVALGGDFGFGGLGQHRQPRVGKAHRLQGPHPEGVVGKPCLLTLSSISTMPRISARNQGSILQELKISFSMHSSLGAMVRGPHSRRSLRRAVCRAPAVETRPGRGP